MGKRKLKQQNGKMKLGRCSKCSRIVSNNNNKLCERCLSIVHKPQMDHPTDSLGNELTMTNQSSVVLRNQQPMVPLTNEASVPLVNLANRATVVMIASQPSMPATNQEDEIVRTRNAAPEPEAVRDCLNCKRRFGPRHLQLQGGLNASLYKQNRLTRVEYCKLRKVKFFNLHGTYEPTFEVPLCDQCLKVITGDKKERAMKIYTWPVFVAGIIGDPELRSTYKDKIWRLIPDTWRKWWIHYARGYPELCHVTLTNPPSCFADQTMDIAFVTNTFRTLRLKDITTMADTLCVFPGIKCPWGCCVHLPETLNDVPYESIMSHALGGMGSYKFAFTKDNEADWLVGIKNDFTTSQHEILYNPEWIARPSICYMEGKGVRVLCCFLHSTASKGRYVHPPSTPFGVLSSQNSDQSAPVIIVPRTLKYSRRKAFTSSYHMNKLEGGYTGIDSAILSNESRYDRCDAVSMRQECLCVAGRADMGSHLQMEVEEGNLCASLADAKLNMAKQTYPKQQLAQVVCDCASSATYVPFEDALQMERDRKLSPMLSVYSQNKNGQPIQLYFKRSWPPSLLGCHLHGDRYGEKRKDPTMPKQQATSDKRLLWVVKNICCHVPVVWSEVGKAVTTTDEWYGWVLYRVAKECFSSQMKYVKNDPFKVAHSDSDLLFQLRGRMRGTTYDPAILASTFEDFKSIKVIKQQNDMHSWINYHNNVDVTVIIVTNNYGLSNGVISGPPDSLVPGTVTPEYSWSCRLVVCTTTPMLENGKWSGKTYSRHGGQCDGWWIQTRQSRKKCHGQTIILPDINEWDVAVYVRTERFSFGEAKKMYMLTMGSQAKFKCQVHDQLLVRSRNDGINCSETEHCHKPGYYVCPYYACRVAICEAHVSGYDGPNEEIYIRNHSVQDDFGEDNSASVQGDYSPHTLSDDSSEDANSMSGEMDLLELDIVDPDSVAELNKTCEEGIYNRACQEEGGSVEDSENDNQEKTALDLENAMQRGDFLTRGIMETDHMDIEEEPIGPSGIIVRKGNDTILVETETEEHIHLDVLHTNTGQIPMHLDVHQRMVGLHVVFNKYQSLLVRFNKKLDASRRERNFLERIVSKSRSSLPLLYPEGLLFPSMFWLGNPDGSIVGAMPGAFLSDNATMKKLGFATMHEQFLTRIMNCNLLASTSSKYQFFVMDACMNLGMRGQDSRIILSRGFTEYNTEEGIRLVNKGELAICDTDSVDSRPVVNKLAAAIGEHMPTFFYTHTCSMRTHIGMRKIRSWLDDERAIQRCCAAFNMDYNTSEYKVLVEMQDMLSSSACSVVMRSWVIICKLWMLYITKSPDQPIGPILKYWYRSELQDLDANVPHIHSILWHKEDDGTPEKLQKMLSLIRASMEGMVTEKEYQEYVHEGILSSRQQLYEILDNLAKFLEHKHNRRCLIPRRNIPIHEVAKVTGADADPNEIMKYFMCKVPDNYMLSTNPSQHTFMYIEVRHSQFAVKVLEKIGLVVRKCGTVRMHDIEQHEDLMYVDELVSKRHIPPTHGHKCVLSPVLSRLAVINPNSDNVQYLDSYSVSKYLAKYVASVDKTHQLYIKAPQYNPPTAMPVSGVKTGNTKIAGVNRIYEKMNKLKRNNCQARAMSQPEQIMLNFGVPQVVTDIEFIHISTSPLEERPGLDRKTPVSRMAEAEEQQMNTYGGTRTDFAPDMDAAKVIPSHAARKTISHWPESRYFVPTSLLLGTDSLYSPITLDSITVFGLRPPELYFIRQPALYFKWFVRRPMYVIVEECTLLEAQLEYCNHNLKVQYECCQWIDALNNVVQVRHAAIPPLMSYVSGLTTAEYHGSDSLRRDVENFVGLLVDIHTTLNSDEQNQRLDTRHSAIDKKFVCKHGLSLLPVIWYKPIKPIYTNRFLIHLVLSMGSYDNELSLFESGSIRNAFILAGLLRNEDVEGSAKRILNKYVTQQLVNMAGGAASFDRMVCAADSAVTCCFRDETMYADGTPPVLYTKLVQAVTAQQLDMLLLWNNNFLHAIVGNINDLRLQSVPSYQSLSEYTTARLMASVSETALDSNIPVVMPWSALGQPRPVTQSLESYSEQQLALNVAEDAVRRYMSASEEVPKCICIVGDPGSGKTTVAMMVMLFCVTRGLHCGATALMSERAMELGGVHFHKLSNCPTQNNLSVLQMAERAIGTMLKTNNSYYHILKKIDVLLIDELGQMSSEAISVLDTILRRIRNSVRFMGGILLITTMDIMQLLPIQGRPPMLSCHMLTSFTFCRLQNSVRSGQDPDFCKLQKMTRLMAHEWNSSTENEFRDLFKRTCTFVNSFDDDSIPRMATYVFGRKHPGQLIHDKVVKRRCQHEEYIVAHARDEEMVLQGNWIPNESDVTSRRLSATLKEPHDLYLFARAVYKITYNDSHRTFSQSQMAILMTLPTRELIKNLKPIVMYACPPGRKEIPPHDCTVSQLLSWGWTRIMIRIAPPQVVNVYSRLRARRHQYGIRLHISTTAHGCMGHTLHSLVTKVSAKEATYKLWSKPQVVVMLSRTNLGKNTIFVGDPDETCDALINTMKKTNQYYQYMQILMTNLIHQTNISSSMMPVIDQRLLPMRASDILLPDDNTGVVYILVSLQNRDVTYIGQTNNLSRRIDQHNTRSGSIQTSSAVLQPWALVAYVSGFGNNKMKRLEFEKQWQAKVHRLGSTLSTNEIVDLGNSIIVDRKEICPDEDLRFIRIESTLDY